MHYIYLNDDGTYTVSAFRAVDDQAAGVPKFIGYLDAAKWLEEFLNCPGSRDQMLKDLRPRRTKQ